MPGYYYHEYLLLGSMHIPITKNKEQQQKIENLPGDARSGVVCCNVTAKWTTSFARTDVHWLLFLIRHACLHCIRLLVTGRWRIHGMKLVFLPRLYAHHSAERTSLEQGAGCMHRVSGCVTKHVTCPDNYRGCRGVDRKQCSCRSHLWCIWPSTRYLLLKHATRPLRGSRFFFSSLSMRVY